MGAGVIAFAAGLVRDNLGDYDLAWYGAGMLCAFAATMSLLIARRPGPDCLTLPVSCSRNDDHLTGLPADPEHRSGHDDTGEGNPCRSRSL